jgi:hypothetical protein
VATLTTKASDFTDGDALDAGCLEGIFHVIQFEGLHDCGYEFHFVVFLSGFSWTTYRKTMSSLT